ncbi:dihydropyrimidinase [Candidatus Sumerlaeota bacterium]|nr:dihydropyrimidinase [Candidatus Sumerlaeota bacterium]
MAFDKVVRGGTVVTPSGPVKADVGIRGERIAAIGEGLSKIDRGAEIIDARGHLVLPGVIDVHVHLDLPVGDTASNDDFVSGTRAAARGGVTTLIDFATPMLRRGGRMDSLSRAVDIWHAKAEGKALVDYAFHVCVIDWPNHRREIPGLIERGYPTFKEFMIYQERHLGVDDDVIFSTLEMMRDLGGLLLIHAESMDVMREMVRRHHTPAMMKKHGAFCHAMSRPNFIEAEAIQRAVTWSGITGGPLHIVHMSTGEGADIIREAQANGTPVLSETCPQYLVLDDSKLRGRNGHLFCTSPQVKSPEDSERLWQGLRDGEISIICTDTCTFTREQRAVWKGDFTRLPMGMPGLETLLPVTYTAGVLGGRLSITDLCQKLSTNPARIMGLAPRKGAIEVGADADLAIIHPKKRIRVDWRKMETNCDWSPYQGWELAGFARTTLSRGEVIVDDHRVVGEKGRGVWLPRRLG